jgi:DNA-binding LytR/AlgR family response regulator
MAKPFSDVALYYNLRSAVGFEAKKNEYSAVTESYREHIFVKMDYKLHKLKVDDIIYIEASKDYVDIYLEKSKYRVNVTMHQMEQALPSDRFVRTHRSFIVNINYINFIKFPEIQLLQTEGMALIGGNYKKEVYQKINVL